MMRTHDSQVGGIALHSGLPTTPGGPRVLRRDPLPPFNPTTFKVGACSSSVLRRGWALNQINAEIGQYASSSSKASKHGNKPSLSTRPSLWEGKERKEERETEAKTGGSLVPQLSSNFCSIK